MLLILLAALPASAQNVRRAAEALERLELQGTFSPPRETPVPAPPIGPLKSIRWGREDFESDAEYEAIWKRYQALSAETEAYRAKHPRPKLDARGADGIDVGQGRAGATRGGVGLPRYLQSDGAGPCVILTLYEARTRSASMAHLDAGTGVRESVERMLARMGSPAGAAVEARLIGGMEGLSGDVLAKAVLKLEKLGIPIVEVDVKLKGEPEVEIEFPDGQRRRYPKLADSIILDTHDGAVYDMRGSVPEEYRTGPPNLDDPSGTPVEFEGGGL